MPAVPGKGHVQRWAENWRRRDGGFEQVIQVLAGYDPVRVLAIKEQCTTLEIAEAYVSRAADMQGIGFK